MSVLGTQKQRRRLALGLAFLAPNVLGFLAFTLVPLLFSLVLAFSNWDLKLHNRFKDEPIHFVGLDNFYRLLSSSEFYWYLGNTLFLMMGMPVAIAASLGSAMLLSKDLRGGSGRIWLILIAGAVLIASTILLAAVGMGQTAMVLLLGGVFGLVLIGGAVGGTTVYRTLFYLPHFTAGVATLLLWKKLYAPQNGPVNNFLSGPLATLGEGVRAVQRDGFNPVRLGLWLCLALAAWLLAIGLGRLRRSWVDGDWGTGAVGLSAACLLLPVGLPMVTLLAGEPWWPGSAAVGLGGAGLALLLWQAARARGGRLFTCPPWEGVGSGLMLALGLVTAMFVLLGLGRVCWELPMMAADGLEPPGWLTHPSWAKPAIMLMGFWGAVGSNTMLLYLAALTNVPQELYEAADIDGARSHDKFWHVTWPQLAPTTFFVVVMGVIGGLQGGFEQARVLTAGGPAGATTTLSYMIYTEGFETGRLGYSSAASWVLFALVLLVTLVNWKFGNKYVND